MTGRRYHQFVLVALALACALAMYLALPMDPLFAALYLLYGALVEYLVHRFPMHNRYHRWNFLYGHTTSHHGRFTPRHLLIERDEDIRYAVIPPHVVYPTVLLMATPLTVLGLHKYIEGVAVGCLYYLVAEMLHFRAHSGSGEHHLGHHSDPRTNFGFSSPLFDVLFRTRRRK